MPALNPFSPPHPTILRSRYWKSPGKWEEVTAEHRFEDGGIAKNELNDDAPVDFEVAFDGLTPEEAEVFDDHYEENKFGTIFEFIAKNGGNYPVFYKSYVASHEAHKSWRQRRQITVSYYPGNGEIVITDIEAPSVPVQSDPTGIGETTITLNWAASTDNIGVTGYKYRIDGGAAVDVGLVTTKALTGLTGETEYDFEIQAYDAAGNHSGWSNLKTATTTAPTLILDSISTNVLGAWSLRKLRNAYSGDAVLVRRAVGLETQAIGFSGAFLDQDAANTFADGEDLEVLEVYNQGEEGTPADYDLESVGDDGHPLLILDLSPGGIPKIQFATGVSGVKCVLRTKNAYSSIQYFQACSIFEWSYQTNSNRYLFGIDNGVPVARAGGAGSALTFTNGSAQTFDDLEDAVQQLTTVQQSGNDIVRTDGSAHAGSGASDWGDTERTNEKWHVGSFAYNQASCMTGSFFEHILMDGGFESGDQGVVEADQIEYGGIS